MTPSASVPPNDAPESVKAALAELIQVRHERDEYKKAYELAKLAYERLRRQLFGAKSEHVDAAQLALAFAELEKIRQQAEGPAASPPPPPADTPKKKSKPTGRRRIDELDLPEERIELTVPGLPANAARVGEDISYRLGYRRASHVRIVVVRPRYAVPSADAHAAETGSATTIVTADAPDELVPRGMLCVDVIAKILTDKFCDHLPFNRQEDRFARDGILLDRATMGRYAEAFHELARHVVDAMACEARRTAAVIATDATGILVQQREQCRRGHFFVLIADRDHVFYRYTPKHNSDAVRAFLGGFNGYVQADACSVYDALFASDDGPTEVGCWAHARRNFFHCIGSDRKRALTAIAFINTLFEIDREMGDLPPAQKLGIRKARAAPVHDDLYRWVREQLVPPLAGDRTPIARALRYLMRHQEALARFLEDGRLRLDNNPSELALRKLVVGRKNCLFVGSDDHADVTATIVSLVASCKLHKLDPESYLRDLCRLLPIWPKSRFLELAPKYWLATRARIDADQLDARLGTITVPPREAQTEQA